MTIVSDDPAWWPVISSARFSSYFVAASSAAVVYDWALTFGQEFELILRQRWSFMTVLYICVRYIGILFSLVNILTNLPILITDAVGVSDSRPTCVIKITTSTAVSTILGYIQAWTPIIVNVMLGVIMIARLNAMYQGSKKLLIFLVVALLASTIASGVMVVIANLGVSAEEAVLSGYDICVTNMDSYMANLIYESMTPTAVWEILALFLAVWIVIKHFHELRRSPTGSTFGDCFRILIESHAFYFLAFAIEASLRIGSLSPNIRNSSSIGSAIYGGIWSIAEVLQMFVLGPRLILSIREYHAKFAPGADGGTAMTSIAFQAGGDALTGGDASTGGDV
ncbi:hypothetical protein F4604DRAFT_1915901 [Suillus subluteus]|nr:hypothetical protein F4604DRAFT_1915901 [Suillus subluteus]